MSRPGIIFALILTLCVFAALAGTASAQTIRVGIGFTLPPYVIKKNNSGLEVDIIRKAFATSGLDTQFVYLPNLRLPVAFADGFVDCIASNTAYNLAGDSGVPAFGSEETITYENRVVTLKNKRFGIRSIEDLTTMAVLSFCNATKYLGPHYMAMAQKNRQYRELADQALLVRMLYSGRVQAVVSDKRIFLYWRKQLLSSSATKPFSMEQDVEFHQVFSPTPRHLSFHDAQLRDSFNRGLRILRKSGEYDNLIQNYTGIEGG